MPKTRNVTRSQWDAANASHASTTRSRKENENGDDSEKENGVRQGRATRSQTTRGRTGVLGAVNTTTTVLGQPKGAKLKTAARGKGKPTAAPLKRKKQPLQDITDQFLPAPEAANRGAEHQNLDEDDITAAHDEPANIVAALSPVDTPVASRLPAPKFTSPLPPSSPPIELPSSPVHRLQSFDTKLAVAQPGSPAPSIPQETYDPWQEFDNAHPESQDSPAPANSNSDPFGFVALERKLKVERETAITLGPDHDHDADADQESDGLEHILVADTSSPRPVRRLKRPLYDNADEAEHHADEDDASDTGIPPVLPHVHYATPPTPHKDKQKRPRLSHEGHDVFSPCSSSVESSPSPTKASARKRPCPDLREDALDQFNDELEGSHEVEEGLEKKKAKTSKRTRQAAQGNDVNSDAIARNLRSRDKRRVHNEDESESHDDLTKRSRAPVKIKGAKKPVSKSRSAAARKEKADTIVEEEDHDEKWERARQERVEYFKRLEDYQVEKEDVYLI
ncbi:hypothetical protein BDZ97DRAFT_1922553 [Flammula alnicola]|nr:hypothetical protein BDZ97DRAFT_1922553 [Flammula alnicola]